MCHSYSLLQYKMDDGAVLGERIRRVGSAVRAGDQQQSAADFDQVERGQQILADMRAGRAKAPKRRPPTSAINSQSSVELEVRGQNGGSGSEGK